jgi:hypothetical protein
MENAIPNAIFFTTSEELWQMLMRFSVDTRSTHPKNLDNDQSRHRTN